MKKIANDVTELIGHTPLIALRRYSTKRGLRTPLLAKVEAMNPGGSVKDRIALAMIEDAEREGRLKPGGTIIEPTSGNTGVGLAMIAAVKGYKLILTMPETMSRERQLLAKAYGAEVVLTPGKEGMAGAVRKANELHDVIGNSIIANQFANPANPQRHYETTGMEIWLDTEGEVDAFVAGVGTGGTVSGTGRLLKEKKRDVGIFAVEPASSSILNGGESAPHRIQGIGANFIPDNYDPDVVTEVIDVTDDDAYLTARALAKEEGLLVGISAGAAVSAATSVALRPEWQGKQIVALLPDTGERYLSTDLFGM